MLFGAGFIVSPAEARAIGLGTVTGLSKHIRHYRNGRDLTASPRDVMVIDLFGLTEPEVMSRFPYVYQNVKDKMKPERDANLNDAIKRAWWVFGRPRSEIRPALDGLSRYIVTVETAKHRIFQFLEAKTLADNKLIVLALSDAANLSVLSSHVHVSWAIGQGTLLENRPVYPKSLCFDPFPFPTPTEAQTVRLRVASVKLV